MYRLNVIIVPLIYSFEQSSQEKSEVFLDYLRVFEILKLFLKKKKLQKIWNLRNRVVAFEIILKL